MRARTVASVSVFRSTVIAAPFTVNDPDATLANWLVLASTCWSSRRLPGVVFAASIPAAARKPDVSLPIAIASSVSYVVVNASVFVPASNAAVTRAPDALILETIDWIVSDVVTAIVFPSTTNEPFVTDAKRERSASATPSSRRWPRTVFAVARCTAVRNPLVSAPTVIGSSPFALPVRTRRSSPLSYEAVTPAAEAVMRARTVASVSVFRSTVIAAPFTVNEPDATVANWLVLASTCPSSRRLPRVVFAASIPAAARKPDVSLPIAIASSVSYVVVSPSVFVPASNAAVTRAPDALIFETIDWIVSDVVTAIVFPSTTNEPFVTDAKRERSASTTPSSRRWPRTVFPVARCAAVRNPLVSAPTVIGSSPFVLPVSTSRSSPLS